MTKFMFDLGREAKDKITGFSGIIVARNECLFGCNRYGLSPKMGADGKLVDTEWFDEGRVEIIGNGIAPASVKADKPGADGRLRDDPR